MKLFKKYVDKVVSQTRAGSFFGKMPTIRFYPEVEKCPHCEAKLKQQKSWEKTVVTKEIGAFKARETKLECPNGCEIFVSKQLRSLVPEKCTFGFDIIEDVGTALFIHSRSDREIMQDLALRNVFISEREIGYLGQKFIAYLALVHRESRKQLQNSMRNQGGYILHVDGTCDGDSPLLFCGMDGISELILDNIKIPSESKELLVPFFHRIQKYYGNPIALVHDMGSGILAAIEEVFPGLPDFICHFHFLRDVGRDLLLEDYQAIMKKLRKTKIRARLRQKAKYLEKKMGDNPQEMKNFKTSLESGEIETANVERVPMVATYTLTQWILDGRRESKGYGFPFDRPQVEFYRRLKEAQGMLGDIMNIHLSNETKDNKSLMKLWSQLDKITNDKALNRLFADLAAKAEVFDKLRLSLRIALPKGKDGLNDNGVLADMKTIEKKVGEFKKWLTVDPHRRKIYAKMIQQIDKYWGKLFADPIRVNTPEGDVFIAPQRTNNILERFFRAEKRRARKKTGTASLSKTLKAIITDTPLVRNLDKEDYREIILNGCSSLAERFSQVDSKLVQKYLKEAGDSHEKINPEVKKIIRDAALPKKISELFANNSKKYANCHLRP